MTDNDILRKALSILEKRATYNTKSDVFSSPDCVARYLKIHFAAIHDNAEHFTVLYLDNRHRLIAAETPFHGTIDQAAVYPREILKKALEHGAAALVLAHNHPSGEAEPSQTDIRLTEKLVEAMKLVDIRILDHIIVADNANTTTSMASRNLM